MQVEQQLTTSSSGRKKKSKKWTQKRDYTRTRQRTESLYKDGVHKQQRKAQAEKYQKSHDVRRAASMGLLDSCTGSSITNVSAAPIMHMKKSANGEMKRSVQRFNQGSGGDSGLIITRAKTAPFSPGILKTRRAKELYRKIRPAGTSVYDTLYKNKEAQTKNLIARREHFMDVEKTTYTFEPNLSATKKANGDVHRGDGASSKRARGKASAQRMFDNAVKVQNAKREEEKTGTPKLNRECTFQPAIFHAKYGEPKHLPRLTISTTTVSDQIHP
jgi:hypothetical protein